MKKLAYLLSVAGFALVVACGPSAEEKAAKEKAKQDSIAAAREDSIAKAKAEEEQQAMENETPAEGAETPAAQ